MCMGGPGQARSVGEPAGTDCATAKAPSIAGDGVLRHAAQPRRQIFGAGQAGFAAHRHGRSPGCWPAPEPPPEAPGHLPPPSVDRRRPPQCTGRDRKSTRLNSSHSQISYAVFCLKKKKKKTESLIDINNNETKTTKDRRTSSKVKRT